MIQMPAMASCSQCQRAFPVRAQMQVGETSIPMLVVLEEVGDVESALAQATCQVCLSRQGPVDRGLYRVLKDLGAEDLDSVTPAARGAVVVASRDEQPTRQRVAVVIQRGPPREVAIVDPLVGTSLVLPTMERPGRDRRGPPLHAGRPPSSEPRLPRALREPEPAREPERPVPHLTGAIGASGDNAAVLKAAQEGIRKRDEASRLERARKFNKIFFYLGLTLPRIHKNAATSEVWELVDTFQRKLGEAVSLDPRSRGRNKLLAELGTSSEKLESLCLLAYEKPLAWKRSPGAVCEKMDAFEGGRRPESWDEKGGKKPAFYELEVVRTQSSLPIPNPPLPGGDEDPRPRIVYPEGGEYGPTYEVQNSRHLAGIETKIDELVAEVAGHFKRWLAIAHEDIGIGTEFARLDLTTHIPAFFEDLKRALALEAEEAAEQADGQVAEATEPPTISLDLPAIT